MKLAHLTLGVLTALTLAACGGGGDPGAAGMQDTSGARGSLIQNPPVRVTALSATDFLASLNASPTGQGLLAIAGAPVCDVDVQYLRYGTVGANNEVTNATGALMTPSGSDARCSGARPIVVHAHGTNIGKSYNMAALNDPSNPAYGESLLVTAMYAAQGYIVVAPNYAGYDTSSLSYHPYLNADQSSKEMMDALAAAKKALPNLAIPKTHNGKLFLTGYSQGGHVAMATHRAMQSLGMTVTAAAPMSGPYALSAFADAIFLGNISAGSTIFTPLLSTSYQKAYGNLYTVPSDFFESAYATGIESLLPGSYDFTSVVTSGKLPQLTLFSSTPPTAPVGSPGFLQPTLNALTTSTNPLFAAGFGTTNLIKNSARLAYIVDALNNPDGAVPTPTTGFPAAAPANPLRIAAKTNDLRNWTPTSPVLLCGGNADPTVFFSVNTQAMQGVWTNPSSPIKLASNALLTVVDVDSTFIGDPFATVKAGFAATKTSVFTSAETAVPGSGALAVVGQYHGSLVPPFCHASARAFFSNF